MEDYMPAVHCKESSNITDNVRTVAVNCASEFGLATDVILSCVNITLGNQLQHKNAALTEALSPPHQYTPWVTLNGVHTEDIEDKALSNLVSLICDSYTVNVCFWPEYPAKTWLKKYLQE